MDMCALCIHVYMQMHVYLHVCACMCVGMCVLCLCMCVSGMGWSQKLSPKTPFEVCLLRAVLKETSAGEPLSWGSDFRLSRTIIAFRVSVSRGGR